MKVGACLGGFLNDIPGHCGPGERLWILVAVVDGFSDSGNELFQVSKNVLRIWIATSRGGTSRS